MKVSKIVKKTVTTSVLGSLPDIDMDLPSNFRDKIKQNIRNRYGNDYVASVGTFNSLKLKGALKDLNRVSARANHKDINYISSTINKDAKSYQDLMTSAKTSKKLKKFIDENGDLIEKLPPLLNNCKSKGQHAGAVIIIPKNGSESIYETMPVRIDENGHLVTEWEKDEVEDAGFLKLDLLVVNQLDKFIEVLNDESINLEDIPLNDEKTFKLFRDGFLGDVFQFGSSGLQTYTTQASPQSIDELIAIASLYRPGPMADNAHMKYIQLKNGDIEPDYHFGLKEVTKETYGLFVYQEQIMRACQVLGGFSMQETDDVRRAMGKKKIEVIEAYKKQFVEGAVSRGCSKEEAVLIWDKMVAFSAYAFNKSHATCYAIMGYISNYLKAHRTTKNWRTSLQWSSDEKLPLYISEVNRMEGISLMPPDINYSSTNFTTNLDIKEIYWSLTQIKHVGEKATEAIIEEREKNGEYFSLEDFMERVDTSKVNKTCMTNMIVSGCFDKMYSIEHPKQRRHIMQEYYDHYLPKKEEIPEEFLVDSNVTWTVKQKQACGLADTNFEEVLEDVVNTKSSIKKYAEPSKFLNGDFNGKLALIAGVVTDVVSKKIKNGEMGTITLDNNSNLITLRLWNSEWQVMKGELLGSKGRVLVFLGRCAEPSKFNRYPILQSFLKSSYDLL